MRLCNENKELNSEKSAIQDVADVADDSLKFVIFSVLFVDFDEQLATGGSFSAEFFADLCEISKMHLNRTPGLGKKLFSRFAAKFPNLTSEKCVMHLNRTPGLGNLLLFLEVGVRRRERPFLVVNLISIRKPY